VNVNPGRTAQELVVCRFIDVLKATPPAHVKYENRLERDFAAHNVPKKLAESLPAIQYETTLTSVLIGLHNHESVFVCPVLDCSSLILHGILLVVR
jgi:hypothetical protein